MTEIAKCGLCGEPMPKGEEMFYYHGYSGPCPTAPLPKKKAPALLDLAEAVETVIGKRDLKSPAECKLLATARGAIAADQNLENALYSIREICLQHGDCYFANNQITSIKSLIDATLGDTFTVDGSVDLQIADIAEKRRQAHHRLDTELRRLDARERDLLGLV